MKPLTGYIIFSLRFHPILAWYVFQFDLNFDSICSIHLFRVVKITNSANKFSWLILISALNSGNNITLQTQLPKNWVTQFNKFLAFKIWFSFQWQNLRNSLLYLHNWQSFIPQRKMKKKRADNFKNLPAIFYVFPVASRSKIQKLIRLPSEADRFVRRIEFASFLVPQARRNGQRHSRYERFPSSGYGSHARSIYDVDDGAKTSNWPSQRNRPPFLRLPGRLCYVDRGLPREKSRWADECLIPRGDVRRRLLSSGHAFCGRSPNSLSLSHSLESQMRFPE